MITWVGSPNYTEGRNGKKIDRIIIHWIVGKLAVADKVFQDDVRNTSAHYGVGNSEVHQYVNDSDTAYHSGNWEMNLRSIGIEHEGGLDLPISDETYNTSAQLLADICQRYSIPLDRQHILKHQEIVPTQCPGTLDIDRIIAQANSAIIVQPSTQLEIKDQTKIPQIADENGNPMEVQQIRSKLNDQQRDLDNAVKLADDYFGELEKCLQRPPEAPIQPPMFKNGLAAILYQLVLKLEGR